MSFFWRSVLVISMRDKDVIRGTGQWRESFVLLLNKVKILSETRSKAQRDALCSKRVTLETESLGDWLAWNFLEHQRKLKVNWVHTWIKLEGLPFVHKILCGLQIKICIILFTEHDRFKSQEENNKDGSDMEVLGVSIFLLCFWIRSNYCIAKLMVKESELSLIVCSGAD